MIKRRNSFIALTIAGASLISMWPANAAQFIEDANGEIREAVAYKDGKYLYEGYKEENEYGVYYNNGQEDVRLEDVDSLYEYSKYKNNYISVSNGNYEETINLDNGSIDEEVLSEVDKISAESKLYSRLKRTNKYGSDAEITSFNNIKNNSDINDNWYYFEAKGNEVYKTPEQKENENNIIKSEIELELMEFSKDYTIGGIRFKGSSIHGLKNEIEKFKNDNKTLNNGYKIKSVEIKSMEVKGIDGSLSKESEKSLQSDNKVGEQDNVTKKEKLVVVLIAKEEKEVDNLPDDFILYGDQSIDLSKDNKIVNAKFKTIEYKSTIELEIKSFVDPTIEIAGVKFTAKSAKKLEEQLNNAVLPDEFLEIKLNEYKENSEIRYSVVVVLGFENELLEIPKGLIKFGKKDISEVEAWQATAFLESNLLYESISKDLKGKWNREITLNINQFHSSLTINGVEVQTGTIIDTIKNINKTNFGDDIEVAAKFIESRDEKGNKVRKVQAIIGTNKPIYSINEVPKDFIKYGENNVDIVESYGLLRDKDWGITIEANGIKNNILEEEPEINPEEKPKNELKEKWNTEILINVSQFWGGLSINGIEIATNNPEKTAENINATNFGDDFEVVANIEVNEKEEKIVVITLGTNEIIRNINEVPKDFIKYGGNNVEIVESYGILHDEAWAITIGADGIKNNKSTESKVNSALLSKIYSEQMGTDNDEDVRNDNSNKITYFGFTDGNGNYIDCTKIANIKIFDGNSMVKLEEFNSSKSSNGKKVRIGMPKLVRVLGQDNDYIYCVISVDITNYQPGTEDLLYDDDATSSLKFVQKISKAKKDSTDGGAYIPNSVKSYQIYSDSSDWNYFYIDELIGEENDDIETLIIDGKIFYAKDDKNKKNQSVVRFGKIDLKGSEKLDLVNLSGKKEKKNYSIVKHVSSSEIVADDWCFDNQGNVWAINNGDIYKSRQAMNFQEIYSCDHSFNKINVYDDINLIVWNDEDGGYATYFESEKNQEDIKVTGWNKLSDGTWHLYDAQGNETIGWKNYNNIWYYFNNEGVMQTGWIEDGGKKYYLSNSGVMQTGWIKVEDKWYYCNQSGAMQLNTTIDGYNLDSNGVWIQ